MAAACAPGVSRRTPSSARSRSSERRSILDTCTWDIPSRPPISSWVSPSKWVRTSAVRSRSGSRWRIDAVTTRSSAAAVSSVAPDLATPSVAPSTPDRLSTQFCAPSANASIVSGT